MNHANLELELSELPSKIRDAQQQHIEAIKEQKEAKLEYDVALAQALVSANKPNATEKKSEAIIETRPQMRKVIEAEYAEKMKEAELNYLKDRFNAIRKIASIEIELIKTQLGGS